SASWLSGSTERMSRQIDSASPGSFKLRYSSALESASEIPPFEIDLSLSSMRSPSRAGSGLALLAPELAQEPSERVVEIVHDAFLQGDDRVIRDVDVLRAHFRAAFRDVAQADAELVLEEGSAGDAVERMHLQRRDAHEEARTAERVLLIVIAQDVADVLAEEALDAFAKLLHAVEVSLKHLPGHAGARGKGRDLLVDAVVPG